MKCREKGTDKPKAAKGGSQRKRGNERGTLSASVFPTASTSDEEEGQSLPGSRWPRHEGLEVLLQK